MASPHYIKRHLDFEGRQIHEDELISSPDHLVVLAEPGAGKTELLENLADRLGTERLRANLFRYKKDPPNKDVLIMDGIDELAKLDASAVDLVIAQASDMQPTRVIFASRSSEWDGERYTRLIRDCLGTEPKTVRLQPFDRNEQKELFRYYLPTENFSQFLSEAQKFELDTLLGNPQLLRLFADAYVHNNKVFESKYQIFRDAMLRMAEESNPDIPKRERPSAQVLVGYTEELFSKLLLSDAVGISSSEVEASNSFPYLFSVGNTDDQRLKYVLDTRLFKPADSPELHEPVHRIVAEYCAANYLVRRINDPNDQLTLSRCLSVIAPNATVREELRGMVGWLAALGNEEIQIRTIDLAPYAILANGDPSRLTTKSKHQLLRKLEELALTDPYFRQSDQWRRFSVHGFFSDDILQEVRRIISDGDHASHLPDLLLELLQGSNATSHLANELCDILVDTERSLNTRRLALRNLISVPDHDHTPTIHSLIASSTPDALNLASEMIEKLGVDYFGQACVLLLLKALAGLYPQTPNAVERTIGSRLFVANLISTFKLHDTLWFLDELSSVHSCTCGEEKPHRCTCRNGTSKIIGRLMDRYFDLSADSADAPQVWAWSQNLNFSDHRSPKESSAIAALKSNDELRQSIHLLVFKDLTDFDEIWESRRQLFGSYGHAGLNFQLKDHWAIIDYAFSNDKVDLWAGFFQGHNRYQSEKGPDQLRAHMRDQARRKPEFLKAWSARERKAHVFWKLNKEPRIRKRGRWKRRELKIQEGNRNHLKENRTQIESGQHFGWLTHFADTFLNCPDDILDHIDDSSLPERALRNSIPVLKKDTPSLEELADLQCESKGSRIVQVLHAACLATFRYSGTLAKVDHAVLKAVKTDIDMGYSAIESSERERFEAEINQCVFNAQEHVENFARQYLEPQIAREGEHHTRVDWLRYKPEFSSLLPKLPFEWLCNFPNMPFSALDSLFNLSVEFADRDTLTDLIEKRCREVRDTWPYGPPTVNQKQRRDFWYIRSFLFGDLDCDYVWTDLCRYPDTIFLLEGTTEYRWSVNAEHWPKLNADKIYRLLDAFVEVWPATDLPNHWGSDSPKEERAYRFMRDSLNRLADGDPNQSLPVLELLLTDARFGEFQSSIRHLHAEVLRKQALQDFRAPNTNDISGFLDRNRIASVEDLRALVLEQLEEMQIWINGAETDPRDAFYQGTKHVDENTARNRIVDYLHPRLNPIDVNIPIERHMANSKRCDFTAETSVGGEQNLLTIEVKGQWHEALFTAASEQLYTRYSHHPNAAQQGIYLILWFGPDTKVADRKNSSIHSAAELRAAIEKQMPAELHGRVDVFVLDLTLPSD